MVCSFKQENRKVCIVIAPTACSAGAQRLDMMWDEIILWEVNDVDSESWTTSNHDNKVGIAPNQAELAYSILDLTMTLLDYCSFIGDQVWGNYMKEHQYTSLLSLPSW